jgi:hypothetical protein
MEVGRLREAALDGTEAVGEVLRHAAHQEIGARNRLAERAQPAGSDEVRVEDGVQEGSCGRAAQPRVLAA